MRVVIDPNKHFKEMVEYSEDILAIFPELEAGGVGVVVTQDKDDTDFFYVDDEERGIQVNDCAFFTSEEMWHLIVTDDAGNIVEFEDPCNYPDTIEIEGVLRRGSLVKDSIGLYGVVVRINTCGRDYKDLDDECHGTVHVWMRDEVRHGDDNCQHYTLKNHGDFLTVVQY